MSQPFDLDTCRYQDMFLNHELRSVFRRNYSVYMEKYVKMWESARDPQRLWNSETRDYVFDPADEETGYGLVSTKKI